MTIQDPTPTVRATIPGTAAMWYSTLSKQAAGHNWRITISGNRHGEISLQITHDAPYTILRDGTGIEAGQAVTICRKSLLRGR